MRRAQHHRHRALPRLRGQPQLADRSGYFSVSVDSLLGVEPQDELGFDDFTYALFHETKELTPENKEKLLEMARFFRGQQSKGN